MNDIDWSKMDMAAMWRDWVAKSEAQWSESVSTMLKDPKAGPLLKKQVEEARHMQRMFAEMAQASLALANMPSRSDFEALDERMGRLEDGLAQVGAALTQLRQALQASGAAQADAKPARSRQPARKPALGPAGNRAARA